MNQSKESLQKMLEKVQQKCDSLTLEMKNCRSRIPHLEVDKNKNKKYFYIVCECIQTKIFIIFAEFCKVSKISSSSDTKRTKSAS